MILIVIYSITIYANTLTNGFLYDDRYTIIDNNLIKDFTGLYRLFRMDYFALSGEMSYRPVVTFTYFLDYALYGLKPWGYHLTNLICHAMNGAVLYVFLVLISNQAGVKSFISQNKFISFGNISFLVSLLFVAHPALTETVNAISYREDLLVFLFYIASLILYIFFTANNRNAKLFYPLSCFTYVLALFSKETALTLPLIVYCYEWFNVNRKRGYLYRFFINWYNIGYIFIALFYLYLRFFSFYNPREGKIQAIQAWTANERILTAPILLLNHLKIAMFPISLSADYAWSPTGFIFSGSLLFSLIIAVLLLLGALIIKRSERKVSFGILFLLITLVPTLNIVAIANPFAERYLYLPIVGVAIILAVVIQYIAETSTYRARCILLIFLFFILGIYSVLIVKRNMVWIDDYSLWSDTVRKMPKSYRAHYNLGVSYGEKGKLEDAIQEYKTTLTLKLEYIDAYINLGDALIRLGRFNEAIMPFEVARMLTGDPAVRNNLGNIYFKQDRFDQAIQYYQEALKLKSDYPEARAGLGAAYASKGKLEDAITEFRTALELNPELAEAHYNLGIVYLEKGLTDEARTELEITLKLKPNHLEAYQTLKSIH